jgi:hypothetical protein
MLDMLQRFVGRRGIYIEGSVCCVVRVESVSVVDDSMRAVVVHEPRSPVCRFRRMRQAGEESVESWEAKPPSPPRWEIGTQLKWFFPDEECWDGSVYGGFRVLFAPAALARFLQRDFSGVDKFFE